MEKSWMNLSMLMNTYLNNRAVIVFKILKTT